MAKIDLSTGEMVDDKNRFVDLNEESVLKKRSSQGFNHIQKAIIAVRELLTQENLIREKWERRDEVESKIKLFVQEQSLLSGEKDNLVQTVIDDLFGFGILEKYRKDSEVTEIIIDAPDKIIIERKGSLEKVPEKFTDADDLTNWFDTHIMTLTTGKRPFDEGHPILDVETRDGERIHANRPPVTEYITVNIRKAASQTQYFTAEDFVRLGSASPEMMDFLLKAAKGRLTIMILGKTGSGKTALVRDLVEEGIPDEERVLFIEDTKETNARKPRFLSMQTVNKDGDGDITMTDLFRAGMRMRPDRICVSEIRGEEAGPFLLTTAAGHPGPISTMHAGNPERAVFLLMVYLKRSGEMDMSEEFLKQFIHEQVHIMVFVNREMSGQRRITDIVEVNPLSNKDGLPFTPLFAWEPESQTYVKLAELSDEKKREVLINGGVII